MANVKKLFSSKLITPAFVSEHDAIYVHSLFVMTQPKALITTTQTALIPGHGGFIYAIRFIGGPILVLELQKKVPEDFTIMENRRHLRHYQDTMLNGPLDMVSRS